MTPPALCLADTAHLPDAPAGTGEDDWPALLQAAAGVAAREPLLQGWIERLVLAQPDLRSALAALLAERLQFRGLSEAGLCDLLNAALDGEPVMRRIGADLRAVRRGDPACRGSLHVFLHLKGFHALQTYRAAHALWCAGREPLALALANQAAAVFGIDIHPAARIGAGVMLDHGSGIVIGETAVVDDHVSILQGVTLGGTGKQSGDRHPKLRRGVKVGAGAIILGNIEIGALSQVAAGSVVLQAVPPCCTVAGVPARVVRDYSCTTQS
ncbi:serine O-acetyltransferase [Massilia luteola]|uniref:serine O-acetyltransferase n=1 Tax=Massilia luteola TaxID=3081751 RepID=UPI002ACC1B32|nr:serine O-acetyltransferase [Massilia sp. Gc5]